MDAMRRALRALALLAMMIGVGGCFAWKTVGALPRSADLPADTRLTKYDGTTIILAQSRIENDTIRGYVDGSHVRYVIPLAAVDLIEARQLQPKQSVIAGVLVGGLVYVVVKGLQATQPFGPIPTTP
jgi:hypothetical protein